HGTSAFSGCLLRDPLVAVQPTGPSSQAWLGLGRYWKSVATIRPGRVLGTVPPGMGSVCLAYCYWPDDEPLRVRCVALVGAGLRPGCLRGLQLVLALGPVRPSRP